MDAHKSNSAPLNRKQNLAPQGQRQQRPVLPGHFNLLKNSVPVMGSTPEGKQFAMRQLHPNDETARGGCKIPDEWSGESVAAELRYDTKIAAPSGTDSTWDCIILSTPNPDIPLVYLTRKSNDTWKYDEPTAYNVPGYVNANSGSQQWFTSSSKWSGLNDATTNRPNLGILAQSTRSVYKGITVHLIANSLTDQGMSYAVQYTDSGSIEPLNDTSTSEGGAASDGPANPVLRSYTGIPSEVTQLFDKSAGTVALPAREGAYMSHRFSAPTHLFQGTTAFGEAVALGLGTIKAPTVLGSFPSSGPVEGSKRWLFEPAGDLNFGVILFAGIDKAASLDVKVRAGLECVPKVGSPWTSFTGQSPTLDRSALDGVRMVGGKLAMSYPANYNDWGLLGKVIKGAMNYFLPGSGVAYDWLAERISNAAR